MGTNYYAEWTPGGHGTTDAPASLMTPVTGVRLHICKSHTSFQGAVFNSWSAWKNFLQSNEWHLTIRDEYGGEHSVPKFIADVESVAPENRSRQHQWLVDNYPGDRRINDWLDADGFSFHRGEFS